MELNNTIIIPTDNKTLAQQLFKSVIYDEDVLVLGVLGEDVKATEVVKKADKLANLITQGRKRKVIWIRKPDILKDEIKALKIGAGKDFTAEDVLASLAFSISLGDEVMDIIKKGDYISFIRVDTCFSRAL